MEHVINSEGQMQIRREHWMQVLLSMAHQTAPIMVIHAGITLDEAIEIYLAAMVRQQIELGNPQAVYLLQETGAESTEEKDIYPRCGRLIINSVIA